MAVFRIEKKNNYTVMSNYHLRDTRLSLKAVGLMCKMLSLSDEWNYTTRGLAKICKEGVDAISSTLRELEECGYLVRNQLRDAKGRISSTEYIIYEQPQTDLPDTISPDTEKPYMDNPYTENTAQLNKDKTNTKKLNTDLLNINSIHSDNFDEIDDFERSEAMINDIEMYQEIVKENISYDVLVCDMPYCADRIDEVMDLIVETVCSTKPYTRIGGNNIPTKVVASKFLKLDSEHIKFIFECLDKNTTKVTNIRQYLLTTLYNAPSTISCSFSALVNHDLYGGGRKQNE